MDDIELRSIVDAYLKDAVGFLDEELGHEREQALRYYHGETPDIPERDGFSTMVSRDVYDTVEWIMPSLLKVFHGSQKAVAFEPTGPEDEAHADQATDYINYIYNQDNPGFLISYDCLKDALLQKLGIVKHWWDESPETVEESYQGLSTDELGALETDPGIEIIEMAPDGEADALGLVLYNVAIRKSVMRGRVKIEGVPPEDFLIEPRTRSPECSRFVAHRNDVTRSDLLEMGYDPDQIDMIAADHEADFDEERDARYPEQDERFLNVDRANEIITLYECYLKVDYDGDGVAELRKVVLAGGGQGEILENERIAGDISDHFTWWSPIRTPHSVFGQSIADAVKDLQKLKTILWRQGLDSLYLAIAPETLVDEAGVTDSTYDDLNDRQVGGNIRWNSQRGGQPPQPFVTPSSHRDALEMIAYADQVSERRTGVSAQSTGLNPDLLQNQTATAVNQVMSAAQQKIELIARLAAENFYKRLFRAILKLVIRYQPKERIIRLRNAYVPMDPRAWNAGMDVTIHVGLGTGNADRKMAHLMQILSVQREALAAGAPIVTFKNIYNTLEALTKEAGLPSIEPYFVNPETPLGQEIAASAAGAAGPPQAAEGGGEASAFLAAEQMKAEMEMRKEAARDARERIKAEREFLLKLAELELRQDADRDRIDFDIWKAQAEIEAKYGVALETARIRAELDEQRNLMARFGGGG